MKKNKAHISFTEEEMENVIALGDVLRKIHNRLLAEGRIRVENGKTIWLEIQKDDFTRKI